MARHGEREDVACDEESGRCTDRIPSLPAASGIIFVSVNNHVGEIAWFGFGKSFGGASCGGSPCR